LLHAIRKRERRAFRVQRISHRNFIQSAAAKQDSRWLRISVTMNQQVAAPSPWLNRNRAWMIGLIVAGFLLADIGVDPGPSLPMLIALGMRWGTSSAAAIVWSGVLLAVMAWYAHGLGAVVRLALRLQPSRAKAA
jgi:hypothetical protein